VTIADLSRRLADRGIDHAVIGAFALAVHGVVRASDDVDVLVMDRRCLEADAWGDLARTGIAVDVRRGDADDPLAGVVRLSPPAGICIDVVVGKAAWQHGVLARAQRITWLATELPVATAADTVLLKLYAGGPQDAWDVEQMLDAVPDLRSTVDADVGVLPAECLALWKRIVAGRAAP
jgi:hypothetical protein